MKIALVTGASGGIGSAVAERFASAGYAVVLQYYQHGSRAAQTASRFPENTPFLCVNADFRDQRSVDAMIGTVNERLGRIDVLVNCAGVALPQKLFSDTTDADYDLVFQMNVQGVMRVTRACLDDLIGKRGAIVNLSSIWGVGGGSCEVLYAASKAAIIGFTKSLAAELGPADVRVNCVAPGLIDTAMNAHLSADAKEAFCADTPLGRIGSPSDVADAVLYLSEAAFVTGQVLCCDGGYLN